MFNRVVQVCAACRYQAIMPFGRCPVCHSLVSIAKRGRYAVSTRPK